MLDSRRYEVFVGRFARTLRARHESRFGPAAQPARTVAPDLIEDRFRLFLKAAAQIRPESQAWEYHRPRARGKRARYTIEFLADLYPRSGSARSQGARRGPGHTRPTPGCGCRDQIGLRSLAPRARPGPTDDLRDGGGRRALPDHDRAAKPLPEGVRESLGTSLEGLPEGNRRESAGSCLQSRVTDWTGDPSRRMIMAPASSAPTTDRPVAGRCETSLHRAYSEGPTR